MIRQGEFAVNPVDVEGIRGCFVVPHLRYKRFVAISLFQINRHLIPLMNLAEFKPCNIKLIFFVHTYFIYLRYGDYHIFYDDEPSLPRL